MAFLLVCVSIGNLLYGLSLEERSEGNQHFDSFDSSRRVSTALDTPSRAKQIHNIHIVTRLCTLSA